MISEPIYFQDVFKLVTGDSDLLRARVTELQANEEKRTFHVQLTFPKVVAQKRLDALARDVRQAYRMSDCTIDAVFALESVTEEDVQRTAENALTQIGRKNPFCGAILNNCGVRIEGASITLLLRHGNADLLEEEHLPQTLSQMIEHAIGSPYSVVLADEPLDAEAVRTTLAPVYAPERKPLLRPEPEADNGALLGKPFYEDAPDKIVELDNSSGMCCVVGDMVLMLDPREIPKIKKTILSFYITDYSGSITVKCFVPTKQADAVYEKLKGAKCVLVRGKAEYDTYSNELTIMARDIVPAKLPQRSDNAPKKRVELHAHSKSSAMDAVVTAKALVERAVKFGHKAMALTDHGVVQAFPEAFKTKNKLKSDIKILYGVEGYLIEDAEHYRKTDGKSRYHIIILAQNLVGLKNLYKLISRSHLDYFYRKPLLPRAVIEELREGLLIGSACEAGEVFRAVLEGKSEEEQLRIASFYDYLEIQPIGNNRYLVRNGTVVDDAALQELNCKIIALGDRLGKKTVATCDVHFLDERDEIFRRVLQAGQGFQDADMQPPLFFRTTEEMLAEFSYLPPERAFEVVVENTNWVADQIEDIRPVPAGQFPPKIEGSAETIESIARDNARRLYGDPLPELVETRLRRELDSVIGNGYADLYNIARLLVEHSTQDGYIVGSRGSVGSSFLAYLANITEVNSLPAHYRCPECKYSEFITDGSFSSGFDMPNKDCPKCSCTLIKDGHDIPFETFLGFKGDKQPDIDLNFSGEYQSCAHQYTEEIFGTGYVFRAGTVSTVAEKTAYGYVRAYCEERGLSIHNAEIERIKRGCMDVKRTTGQHPGGVIVLPKGHEIYEFTPIQHPADDSSSSIITTHFDYHSIDENLLKLDILGHDDPTMIKMLEDITGVNARQIPLDDQKVMSLFLNTEALGVTPEDIGSEVGTFAVPEFGTKFVRQMLLDTKPTTFSELVRISGLSHGTDVWTNNAQDLVRSGICTLKDAICCRDDIMLYLILKEMPPSRAFKIMEQVRKGKKLTPEDEEEMREHNVPEWYIESCNKIQYMFPRAHAAAYVTMSFRVAYFKVYYPMAFYRSYYTVRADTFDYETMAQGRDTVRTQLQNLYAMEKPTAKDKVTLTILEVVNEMYARGIEFAPVDIYESHPYRFLEKDGKILPSLNSIAGLGLKAAESIAAARADGTFFSIDEFKQRTGVSETNVEQFRRFGCFGNLPQSAQVSLFDAM